MVKNKVCVIVPVRNRKKLTLRFLDSFKNSVFKNYEIVIIDDASTDGTYEAINENYKEITLIKGNGNLWWTGGTNIGIRYALGKDFDYILTINDDALVKKDFLLKLIETAEAYPKAIIGSFIKIANTNKVWAVGGSIQWNNVNLLKRNFENELVDDVLNSLKNPYEVENLMGDGTLFPVEVFRKIGFYDEYWFPHYHADTEMILRARKNGYKALVCLGAVLDNEVTNIPNVDPFDRNKVIFSKKSDVYWKPIVKLFISYAPIQYKLFFFRQYYNYFYSNPIFKFYRDFKKIIKKII